MGKKKFIQENLPKMVQCDGCGVDTKSSHATRIKATLSEMSEDAIYEGSSASCQLLLCPKCAKRAHLAVVNTIKRIQKETLDKPVAEG